MCSQMGRDAGRGSGRVWLMQGRGSLVKRGATSEKGSSQAGPCRDDETKGAPRITTTGSGRARDDSPEHGQATAFLDDAQFIHRKGLPA